MFTVRIWDLPTRLFHWLMAACVTGLIITGQVGGSAMFWHFRFGYALFTLLIFRVLWGFLGGYWSRWSQLPVHPAGLIAYWQGRATVQHLAGHNPLGSLSILAMLLVLAFQLGTGLVSDDEIATTGPLSSLVSGAVVSWATGWHKSWGKWLLILLVLLHLLALIWYHWRKRQALVAAMWHGHKTLTEPVQSSRDGWMPRLLAMIILSLSGLVVLAIVSMGH
jgi:cytochrome b